jgi:hypothetical protein
LATGKYAIFDTVLAIFHRRTVMRLEPQKTTNAGTLAALRAGR